MPGLFASTLLLPALKTWKSLAETEIIREKYRLRRICTSHFRGWHIYSTYVETLLDCGVYRVQCTPSFTHRQFHCNPKTLHPFPRGLQRDVVYLSWPIVPSYMSPNAGGGVSGSQRMSTAVHMFTWSPNKLWRSNSIFNLCPPSNVQQLIANSHILIILVTSLRRRAFALPSTFHYGKELHKEDW